MEKQYLVFLGNQGLFALPVECVSETLRPPQSTALRDLPTFVTGIARVRGIALPLLDIGALAEGHPLANPQRLLVLALENDRRIGLLTTEVLGIHPAEDLHLAAAPPLLQGAGEAAIHTLGNLDGELLSVLELGRIVPEEVWQAIEHAEQPL